MFFLKIFIEIYNSHTKQFTHLKCTIECSIINIYVFSFPIFNIFFIEV